LGLRKFSRVSLYTQNSLVCMGPRSFANNWQQGNAGVSDGLDPAWQPDEREHRDVTIHKATCKRSRGEEHPECGDSAQRDLKGET